MNDDAMSLGGIIFGVFALFLTIGGVVYIASVNASTPSATDSYGCSTAIQDAAMNGTLNATNAMMTTGTASGIFVILIAAVVTVAAVAFAFYVVSKTGR